MLTPNKRFSWKKKRYLRFLFNSSDRFSTRWPREYFLFYHHHALDLRVFRFPIVRISTFPKTRICVYTVYALCSMFITLITWKKMVSSSVYNYRSVYRTIVLSLQTPEIGICTFCWRISMPWRLDSGCLYESSLYVQDVHSHYM